MTHPFFGDRSSDLPMTRLTSIETARGSVDVSWAGGTSQQWNNQLCFGLEDGRLMFSAADATQAKAGGSPVNKLGDPINGVAVSGETLAVTSRSEVVIAVPRNPRVPVSRRAIIPLGAHSVLTAPDGIFLAPSGTAGIIVASPNLNTSLKATITRIPDRDLYYYRLAQSPGILVGAVREQGIVIFPSPFNSGRDATGLSVGGFDVVDICPISPNSHPAAYAAIDITGALMLFHDVTDRQRPVAVRFQQLVGRPYRLISDGYNFIVLTSEGLFLLADLADRFLRNQRVTGVPTFVRATPLEAIDMNVVHGDHLLIVLTDMVVAIEMKDFVPGLLGDNGRNETPVEPLDTDPDWHQYTPATEEDLGEAAEDLEELALNR